MISIIGNSTVVRQSFTKSTWYQRLQQNGQMNPGGSSPAQCWRNGTDVACGTGVVARSASRRMRHGHVTGLDLNKGMLAVAQTVVSEGARINWIEGSALRSAIPGGKI